MPRGLSPFWAVLLGIAVTATGVAAPCDMTMTIDDWLQCRIVELQKQKVKQSALDKQTEQPSLSSGSTSLLDKTSASDLVGMGLNLFGAGGSASPVGGTSPTVTASAYALVTAARGDNPLDPTVYTAGKNWRRFSFTLGHEEASEKENLNEARVFGGKVLIVDHRDVSGRYSQDLLRGVSTALILSNVRYNGFSAKVRAFLYDTLGPRIDNSKYPLGGTAAQKVAFSNTELAEKTPKFQQTLALLTSDELGEIDKIATRDGIAQAFYEQEKDIKKVVSQIRTAPQFAISYTGKVRDRTVANQQFDEHRFEASFDYGLAGHTNVTLNASYEYRDSKIIGGDKRGGRVAGELLFELNHDQALAKSINPYTFSMAFEGNFLKRTDNTFRGQGKLVVPITSGISLPISVTYANRTELINESEIRGQFGLTFDVAKLAQAFVSK